MGDIRPGTRVVSYIRVSSDREDKYGPEEQRADIARFAARERLSIVEEVSDLDVSGTVALEARKGLSRALSLVEAGTVDAPLVARFDRLGRDTFECLWIERRFREVGSEVICAQGLNGDEPLIEAMRTVMYTFATLDRQQLVA